MKRTLTALQNTLRQVIQFIKIHQIHGRALNFEEFAMRLDYTFDSFPDIGFKILSAITEENSVAITWIMTVTNNGKNGIFPPTGKSIRATGSTMYHFSNGKVFGHSQFIEKTTTMKELELLNQCKNETPLSQ